MKFATIGHFGDEHLQLLPKDWIHKDLIVSPEFNFDRTKGYAIGIRFSPQQMMALPRDRIQEKILDAVLFAQNELDVNLIQLGALYNISYFRGKMAYRTEGL